MSAVWTRGDTALGARLDAGDVRRLRSDARRIVTRVSTDAGPFLVKRFRVGSGRHALRERWKQRIGRAPAEREWDALVAMRAAGIPVAEPLALGTLQDGDRLLALTWIDGISLARAFDADVRTRRALAESLGALLARVHATGWVHGDLHAGNVLLGAGGPVLLDWQHARRTTSPSARRRDLARLEHGIAHFAPRSLRMRLRLAALGPGASPDALREAGRAADARAAEHARSRTQHACRPGRMADRHASRGRVGLVLRNVGSLEVDALLDAHAAAAAARDGRVLEASARSRVTAHSLGWISVVVKETPWRGLLRALADALRGSAAARAWRGGHGLAARGIGAALPLAALERRVLGVPVASWLVLEDLRPAPLATFAVERGELAAEAVADALARLAIALHRRGADHGDLKSTHVFLAREDARLVPKLIDLEGVRFPRRLSEARRVQALVELNASLPDSLPAALRCRAFARYAAALPFAQGAAAARRAIARASLARRHRWTGVGCAEAAPGRSG